MSKESRSDCPINLPLEVPGGRWTLLVQRDMIFGGQRHFRQLLASQEGISSNVPSDRLFTVTQQGLITRNDDSSHRQKST